MSGQFARSLASYLERLVLGPPHGGAPSGLPGMAAYPLLPRTLGLDPPDVITLSEALSRGLQVRDMGVVSRVHVDNPLAATVLAGESEILMGPTQLRAVQFSCLLPPQRRSSLPVSCVQERQPTQHLAGFTASDACPWGVRTAKMGQLARHGEPPQSWLWDSITAYLEETGTLSSTRDLHAVLDRFAPQLESLASAFPCLPGQVGVVFAVGPELFMEVFADPEIFADRYPLVLRSALCEALARPTEVIVPPQQVPAFMQQVVAASQASRLLDTRSLKAEGRPLAFATPTVAGSALVAHGRLLHLAARQYCPSMGQPGRDLQPEMEAQAAQWAAQNPGVLDELKHAYAARRERYEAFKSRLGPLTPDAVPAPATTPAPSSPPAPDPSDAARPLPLSQPLHALFWRLFSRD